MTTPVVELSEEAGPIVTLSETAPVVELSEDAGPIVTLSED